MIDCDIIFRKSLFNDILNGANEFLLTDLLTPDPKRTRYFLHSLIKFYCFKSERQTQIDQVTADLVEIFHSL